MISLSNVPELVVAGCNCLLFGCKLDGVDMGRLLILRYSYWWKGN